MDVVGSVSQCDPAYTGLKGNRYYTPNGNATLQCGGARLPLAQVQAKYANEAGSTAGPLPSPAEAVRMAADLIASWR